MADAAPVPATTALLFHHVGPVRAGTHRSLTVLPDQFVSLMAALDRAGFVGVAARDMEGAERAPGSAEASRRHPVVLTFDDAYADVAAFALPALARFGFRATVFVVGLTIGGSNTWDAGDGAGGHRIMTVDDLLAWTAQGCEVASHGMSHVDLRTLDDAALASELETSRTHLAALVDEPVTSFAYPYGAHDDRVRGWTMGTYARAFGIEAGRNGTDADRSQLRRTMVQPADTAVDVVLRARLGWSPLERVRAAVRPRARARALQAQLRNRLGSSYRG